MTNELFIKIIGAIITILVSLITAFVIPWLKSKVSQSELEKLDYYLNIAVRCANQIYDKDQWSEKKSYVTTYITKVVNEKLNLSLGDDEISLLIEGVVNMVKGE